MADEIEENGFDIDAGVAEIAESMGFGAPDEDFEEDSGETKDVPEESTNTEEEAADDNPEPTARPAPASWGKEQRETWDQLPDAAKDYIELREKQAADGMNGYKEAKGYADEMQRILEPYRATMQKNNVTETQAIANLFGHHIALTEGPLETRQQAFVRLGQSIGLIPVDGQAQPDPRTQELQQRLDRIEQQEQERQKQAYEQNYSKVAQDVEAFAASPDNPYFEEVADDIMLHLQTGMDLKAAYDRAVWSNPITRAKEVAKAAEEQASALAKKRTDEAKRAAKARGANVRSASTNKASSEPMGSWEDTMNEVIAKQRSN